MEIDIRKHILNNFKSDDKDAIRRAIDSSIEENDEITLPGLGVFLEIIWKNSDDNLKEILLSIIENHVK